jgi:hypothetical protein
MTFEEHFNLIRAIMYKYLTRANTTVHVRGLFPFPRVLTTMN